jgi:hypothetical protein
MGHEPAPWWKVRSVFRALRRSNSRASCQHGIIAMSFPVNTLSANGLASDLVARTTRIGTAPPRWICCVAPTQSLARCGAFQHVVGDVSPISRWYASPAQYGANTGPLDARRPDSATAPIRAGCPPVARRDPVILSPAPSPVKGAGARLSVFVYSFIRWPALVYRQHG